MGVTCDMPPNTPFFTHFFSAPPNTTVSPPEDIMRPVPNIPIAGVVVPAVPAVPVVPTVLPMAPVTAVEGAGTLHSIATPDLNALLAAQLISMGHMQMQMLRSISKPTQLSLGPQNELPKLLDNGAIAIDADKTYPKVNEFFERAMTKDPGRNLRPVLAKLTDGGFYRIDEITYLTEEELMEKVGLLLAEAKWLLREVRTAIIAGL